MTPNRDSAESLIAKEDEFVLPTYAKFPFLLVRGEGNYVFDSAGRRYLDLYGGHAVCILGHSHPALVEAISAQSRDLLFYSNVCYHPARGEAAEHLVRRSYDSMAQVYFCNSGAEANETALKIARRFTGRSRIASMEDGFHGRTIGPLSVTGRPALRDDFPDNLSSLTDFVPFGDMDAIRNLRPDTLAAVILEPIQSMAGVRIASEAYYRELREYCSQHGIVLVFDEVQTAPARTGPWFAGENWGVEPDLVTCAKGIGGGFPVAAIIANRAIASTVRVGEHGSTFGGGPVAMAAVAATFESLEREGIQERVADLSRAVFERLGSYVEKGAVQEVRGLGYLIGVQCRRSAREITAGLRERGILVGTSYQPETFRLLPPLTVGEEEWERFFEAFEEVLGD